MDKESSIIKDSILASTGGRHGEASTTLFRQGKDDPEKRVLGLPKIPVNMTTLKSHLQPLHVESIASSTWLSLASFTYYIVLILNFAEFATMLNAGRRLSTAFTL